MRFLVRFNPSQNPRDELLRSVRTVAISTGVAAKNPKWTSKGGLEVDIFAPSRADYQTFTAAIEPLASFEFTRDLNEAPRHKSEEEVFASAKSYFDSERYWEAHEELEGLWRNMVGAEKSYVQGVILICAAFVHHQKGEEEVARGVLRRALKQLDYPAPEYHGIDVSRLKKRAEEIASAGEFEPFEI